MHKIAISLTSILKTSLIVFSNTSKLWSDKINKAKFDNRSSSKNEAKSLSTSFTSLKRSIRIDYIIFYAKKAVNLLSNMFIQVSVFYYFDQKYYKYIKTNLFDYIIYRVLS